MASPLQCVLPLEVCAVVMGFLSEKTLRSLRVTCRRMIEALHLAVKSRIVVRYCIWFGKWTMEREQLCVVPMNGVSTSLSRRLTDVELSVDSVGDGFLKSISTLQRLCLRGEFKSIGSEFLMSCRNLEVMELQSRP